MRNHTLRSLSLYETGLGNLSVIFFSAVLIIKLIAQFIYGITLPITFIFIISLVCFYIVLRKHTNIINGIEKTLSTLSNLSVVKLSIIVFLVSFITKLAFGIILHVDSSTMNTDIKVYQVVAQEIADYGRVTSYADYCNSFPHILWFGLILSPIVKVFGSSPLFFCIYLDLLLSFSCVCLFNVFKRLSKIKSFIAIIVYSLLPSTVVLPQFVTHEIALLFFLSIGLWLFFGSVAQTNSRNKIILFSTSAIVISISSQINAIGLIAIVSVLIYCLFFNKDEKLFVRIIKCIAIVMTFLLVSSSMNMGKVQLLDSQKLSSLKVNGIEWTLYIGANTEKHGGFSDEDLERWGYNSEDSNTFEEKGLSDDQVTEIRHNLLFQRYSELIKNPKGLLANILVKSLRIWAYCNYPLSELTAKYNNLYSEWIKPLLSAFELYLSLICLVLALTSMRKTNLLKRGEYQFSILFLIGSTIMFLVTECTSKYTISMQPFFWIILFLNIGRDNILTRTMKKYTK